MILYLRTKIQSKLRAKRTMMAKAKDHDRFRSKGDKPEEGISLVGDGRGTTSVFWAGRTAFSTARAGLTSTRSEAILETEVWGVPNIWTTIVVSTPLR